VRGYNIRFIMEYKGKLHYNKVQNRRVKIIADGGERAGAC
jgi:hypothetical protein